jgi:carotenoid cleavage dioxygenase
MADGPSENPFLTGDYAPIRSEDDFELTVKGELPGDLRGVLLRIGPNPQFQPRGAYHWFGGDGMVHAFHLADGKARYRNRYVRTPKWRLENEAGRALFGGFGGAGSDPATAGVDAGVANTNVLRHGGKVMALEEAHRPFAITEALDSVGYLDAYGGPTTAHPKIDPVTGEMVWFAYGVPRPLASGMRYGVTAPDGTITRRQDFQPPYAAMVHDFMVSAGHALIPVLPLTASLERAKAGGPAYAWEPEAGGWLGLVRRDYGAGSIRWLPVPACYVFHAMNAWEEDGKLVADVMRYDRAPLFPAVDGAPAGPTFARLTRWTIDLSGRTDVVAEELLDDRPGEFPRIDERWATRRNRHGWFQLDDAAGPSGVRHVDVETGRRRTYQLPPGDIASEPVFVARGPGEGDGWITTVVWRAAENRSDLLILDALDVEAGPIATLEVPRRVPFGFHGQWLAA